MESKPRNNSRDDQLIFYYVDGKDFLKIFDRRDAFHLHVLELNEREREILLACVDVISFQELQEILTHVPGDQLSSILLSFKNKGIIFEEDNNFLSLPSHYANARIRVRC